MLPSMSLLLSKVGHGGTYFQDPLVYLWQENTMSECSDFILKDHHHPLILGVWPQMDDYYIIITVLLPDFFSSSNPRYPSILETDLRL